METIGDILQKNQDKDYELPTCPYCGKSYKWFIRDLFLGGDKRTLKVPVPDCKCQELREREAERQRILRHKSERLAKLFSNSMITPLFKEKTFQLFGPFPFPKQGLLEFLYFQLRLTISILPIVFVFEF